MVCQRFCAELDKQKIDFDDFDDKKWATVFGSSSNRLLKHGTLFLIFRIIETLLITGICVWSFVEYVLMGCTAYWFIYLTHITLSIEVLYFWCATATTAIAHSRDPANPGKAPWLVGVTWLLFDVSLPGTFMVFVMYWGLVYPYSTSLAAISVMTHGVNFLVMVVDTFVSKQPYYLLHSIYFFFFAAGYLLFSFVYYKMGGCDCDGNAYIYASVDWSETHSTFILTTIIVLVIVPTVNLIFWFSVNIIFPGNYQELPQ